MKSAFTLIELLVVISIIIILLTILLPALRLSKNKGLDLGCVNNLKSIGNAFQYYVNDHDEWIYPYYSKSKYSIKTFWDQLFYTEYLGRKKEFLLCPRWKSADGKFTNNSSPLAGTFYFYSGPYGQNFLLNPRYDVLGWDTGLFRINQFNWPSQTVVTADSNLAGSLSEGYVVKPWSYYCVSRIHSGGSEIFILDGHVEWRRRLSFGLGLYWSPTDTEPRN